LASQTSLTSFEVENGFKIIYIESNLVPMVCYHPTLPEQDSSSLSLREGGNDERPWEGGCIERIIL